MKAAVFVRYHSGDGAGHVAWVFDAGGGRAVSGSVENHSGHIFTPASKMGFWEAVDEAPVAHMRAHSYDEAKWIDVETPDPAAAYRTTLWIKHQAYHAIHRNCEDDVYDVLRAYGAKGLPPPLLHWLPKGWFRAFRGERIATAQFRWNADGPAPRALDAAFFRSARPKRPSWRTPWHVHYPLLTALKMLHFVLWAFR